jgi:hypothetical protein
MLGTRPRGDAADALGTSIASATPLLPYTPGQQVRRR